MGKMSLVIKIFLRKLSRGLWCKLRSSLDKFYGIEHKPNIIFNINFNPLKQQNRVALVYLYEKNINTPESTSYHPNYYQHFIIQKVLIDKDYIVDIYSCLDKSIDDSLLENIQYDMILGFGAVYVQLCKLFPNAKKILFLTENAPWVVRKNFQERVDYYHQRHSQKISIVPRTGYYSDEMFEISDEGIAMSGSFNISRMKERLPSISQIFVNALIPNSASAQIDFEKNKNRFVWFGSAGIIHKGLDILIDAFAELPELQLDVYGAPEEEIIDYPCPSNVIIHKKIDVASESFVNDVVNKHVFVLSLSCSEGMMSGIATCMHAGLIPIVTKETGYDDCPYVIPFDDWHINNVKVDLVKSASLLYEDLKFRSKGIIEWSKHRNTNQNFTMSIDDFLTNFNSPKLKND